VNATTDLPRSQSDTTHAFIVAWVFSLAFYFLEYAVRSSPAVMIPQLAKTFGCLDARCKRHPRDVLLHLLDRESRRGGLARPVGG